MRRTAPHLVLPDGMGSYWISRAASKYEKALDIGVPGRLQHLGCQNQIGCDRRHRIGRGYAGRRNGTCRMHNVIDTFANAATIFNARQIGIDCLDTGIANNHRTLVKGNAYPRIGLQQSLNKMGPDKSGTPGYQHTLTRKEHVCLQNQ